LALPGKQAAGGRATPNIARLAIRIILHLADLVPVHIEGEAGAVQVIGDKVLQVTALAHGGAARAGIKWCASPVMTNGRGPRRGRALLPAYHTSAALDDKIWLKFN
jgi:hypothetical protein